MRQPTPRSAGLDDDATLLRALLDRHPAAWRRFHQRFDRLILSCIQRVLTRFRSVVATDDVDEIFAKFLVSLTNREFHKLRSYSPERGTKLSTWIGMLASNAAWDHLRSAARRPKRTDLSEATPLPSLAPTPLEVTLKRERWTLVERALERCSDRDQQFVQMFYVQGLSPEEIAEQLCVSIKTVYSKKHKICRKLEREVARLAA